ncbi:MAG: hydroxypyruvate isomerase family protein [Chloroflexota bacterium]|nr:hydroxypyruvate isomerase family protein [Chloroflexota bacterium]
MPRFAANLTMLFSEYPFIERFDRAAAAGFEAVEFLFPYAEDVNAIRDALTRNGLTQVLFNLPAGDFAAGERGFANDPARINEFRDGVGRALEIAATLECGQINCLIGLNREDIPIETQWETVCGNLYYAAETARAAGVRQLIEPLNTIDTPGFLLTTTQQAIELIDEAGSDNLFVQYDVYHAQRMEGNVTSTIARQVSAGTIKHIQIADSPGRNEPGTGELHWPYVFEMIDASGYDGWVSAEYRPRGTTEEGLGWLKR